jgi:hypothetical protein
VNLRKSPEIFALALLLILLAYVIPGDLNLVAKANGSGTLPVVLEALPGVFACPSRPAPYSTPQRPMPQPVYGGAELI